MICLTRFSSLAVSTRPQNETVSLKYFALQQRRHDSEAATSRVEHLEEKVQQNLTRQLYGANGQSPATAFQAVSFSSSAGKWEEWLNTGTARTRLSMSNTTSSG